MYLENLDTGWNLGIFHLLQLSHNLSFGWILSIYTYIQHINVLGGYKIYVSVYNIHQHVFLQYWSIIYQHFINMSDVSYPVGLCMDTMQTTVSKSGPQKISNPKWVFLFSSVLCWVLKENIIFLKEHVGTETFDPFDVVIVPVLMIEYNIIL